jgi:hypothetical protein
MTIDLGTIARKGFSLGSTTAKKRFRFGQIHDMAFAHDHCRRSSTVFGDESRSPRGSQERDPKTERRSRARFDTVEMD